MPVDTQEAAERQATVDQAALEAGEKALSSTFGQYPLEECRTASPELTGTRVRKIKTRSCDVSAGRTRDSIRHGCACAHQRRPRRQELWESRVRVECTADTSIRERVSSLAEGCRCRRGASTCLAWARWASESACRNPCLGGHHKHGKYWCYVKRSPASLCERNRHQHGDGGWLLRQGRRLRGRQGGDCFSRSTVAREMNPSTAAE